MEIQISELLYKTLQNKHLLLDTNVFIDSTCKPKSFSNFFNDLKDNSVTLCTIDLVKIEFLKGAADQSKYTSKTNIINEITNEVTIPITAKTNELTYELIQEYKITGSSLKIADFYLGAILQQYNPNIYLMTRDLSDFIQSIFDVVSIVNIPHNKGIFTYGIYQYIKK